MGCGSEGESGGNKGESTNETEGESHFDLYKRMDFKEWLELGDELVKGQSMELGRDGGKDTREIIFYISGLVSPS